MMRGLMLALLLAPAIRDKDNQARWEKRVENGPDREVPGFGGSAVRPGVQGAAGGAISVI